MWVPINSRTFSGSCSKNCGFRIAQVVRCHSKNGILYSENWILNYGSCSENTSELSESSENGLFTPRAFFSEIGVAPRLLIRCDKKEKGHGLLDWSGQCWQDNLDAYADLWQDSSVLALPPAKIWRCNHAQSVLPYLGHGWARGCTKSLGRLHHQCKRRNLHGWCCRSSPLWFGKGRATSVARKQHASGFARGSSWE